MEDLKMLLGVLVSGLQSALATYTLMNPWSNHEESQEFDLSVHGAAFTASNRITSPCPASC